MMTTIKDERRVSDDCSGLKIEPLHVFDVAEHLDSPEIIAAYLTEFFEDGDSAEIADALNDSARAVGMAEIASRTGLAREALYKALRPGSQPRFDTILKVVRALGFKLVVQPALNVEKSANEEDSNS